MHLRFVSVSVSGLEQKKKRSVWASVVIANARHILNAVLQSSPVNAHVMNTFGLCGSTLCNGGYAALPNCPICMLILVALLTYTDGKSRGKIHCDRVDYIPPPLQAP